MKFMGNPFNPLPSSHWQQRLHESERAKDVLVLALKDAQTQAKGQSFSNSGGLKVLKQGQHVIVGYEVSAFDR